MRMPIFAASFAAAALLPSIALAQDSCQREHSQQVVGIVAGAGVGAVAGNVVAGRGDKTLGTIIGAVAGGIIGNQIAQPNGDCRQAYGYYDKNNRWHATGVASADARGYYDRDGRWMEGAPNGHYDSANRWVVGGNAEVGGSYSQGGWVPASANGYYDRNDRWVAGSAAGYYNARGRWVAGPTSGRYDERGRWQAGADSGRRDANGDWVAEPQSGYYDTNGRWQAGAATGYYDTRGRWVTTGSGAYASADVRGPRHLLVQMSSLEGYARSQEGQRNLRRGEASRIMVELRAIRSREAAMRHDRNGELSIRDEAALQLRLDRVSARLGMRGT